MIFPKKIMKFTAAAALAVTITGTGAFALYPAQSTAGSLNVRSTPGGAVITAIPRGTKMAIIENSSSWYKVAVNGVTGYVSGKYTAGMPNSDFSIGKGTITGMANVNIRETPSTYANVLTQLAEGTSVSVVGVRDGWYKIQFGSGTVGYIFPPYLKVGGASSSGSGASSDTSNSYSGSSSSTVSEAVRRRNLIVNYAATFLGVRYVWGGTSPSGFDCSGLVYYTYKNGLGITLPRTSASQYAALTHVKMNQLLPGDLVFFGGGSVSHVGIYVGDGQFIHSPNSGSSVKYSTLWSGYYYNRFIGGGRVIFD